MSNPSAIAAVTATLRNLLAVGVTPELNLNDTTVTTRPPDRARATGNEANQLNVFLYQALPNAAWRNMDMPGRGNPGEKSMPPLALNLYFIVTAFGRGDDLKQPFSLELIGKAMSILHDHAILLAEDIRNALPNNDLHAQIEHVRLTLQPLTTEEIYRLWSGFQTPYRTSVAYEASVVLIDSTVAVKAALPILTRGPADTGFNTQPSLIPPFPEITDITLPNGQRTATLADTVIFEGHNFTGDVQVLFRHARLPKPIRIVPQAGGSANKITVIIENDSSKWVAGHYTVSIESTNNKATPKERIRLSNEVSVALSPSITTEFPIKGHAGNLTINLACSPQVAPEQRCAILLGDREIIAEPLTDSSHKLRFVAKAIEAGSHLVRLRVDGVDSLITDNSKPVPVFRNHRVEIK
ncbi:DUF4255 domain-containing protein [Edaphobacter sp. HDX4]|uniref:DUF4255 domain-containing protein n=1 Tax=Edaphobacter sp. HDX4 TaxID=2794064 RepID=UPI002FE58493